MNFVEFKKMLGRLGSPEVGKTQDLKVAVQKHVDMSITLIEAVFRQSTGDWERVQAADLPQPQGTSG